MGNCYWQLADAESTAAAVLATRNCPSAVSTQQPATALFKDTVARCATPAITHTWCGAGRLTWQIPVVYPSQAMVLGPGDHVEATAGASAGLRFLLIAGKPIGEPIVQHGPFVMNTQEEIYQVGTETRRGGREEERRRARCRRRERHIWRETERSKMQAVMHEQMGVAQLAVCETCMPSL